MLCICHEASFTKYLMTGNLSLKILYIMWQIIEWIRNEIYTNVYLFRLIYISHMMKFNEWLSLRFLLQFIGKSINSFWRSHTSFWSGEMYIVLTFTFLGGKQLTDVALTNEIIYNSDAKIGHQIKFCRCRNSLRK